MLLSMALTALAACDLPVCFGGAPDQPDRCTATDCQTYVCENDGGCGAGNNVCIPTGGGGAACA
ncbi:uncharacterized protein MYCGRDRAFT_79286 [Zymoseptoria tritici IPO323]|nr:uncharacterized protein MYCGRDRAFT_79286 [Zymoseptoria tritici IPO323]EGP90658.1 hypothetical protein MYCGRDRAFT_79286 [Zymoseptoria tritici IPO323]